MSRKPVFIGLGALALVAVVVVGLLQAGGGSAADHGPPVPTPAEARAKLAGAPPPLAALHDQMGKLVETSVKDVEARLRDLRGHPVVVNKWASWCAPCRLEFPVFQRVSVTLGKDVAFIGLDSNDVQSGAAQFLRDNPTSYPSFVDPHSKIARRLGAGDFFPTTLFYDKQGKQQFVHQGGYTEDAKLLADVRRYALGTGS
jgi:thiol-disulfide isomerase/thioredoxin